MASYKTGPPIPERSALRDKDNFECTFLVLCPGCSLLRVVLLEDRGECCARATPVGAKIHSDGCAASQDVPCLEDLEHGHKPVPRRVTMPIMNGQDGAENVEPQAGAGVWCVRE